MPDIVIPPLINGRAFSFSSIEVFGRGGVNKLQLFLTSTDISYGESLEFDFQNGTARVPLGNTAGLWKPQEVTLQCSKTDFQLQVVQGIGQGWLGINYTLNVAYADIGQPIIVDAISCRITGVDDAHSHGPSALQVALKMMTTEPIMRNGVSSMKNRAI